ncbi:MAG: hypothetical protein EA415_12975 [Sphaerobacteraceae bacterium]|nr:MAG: hypothetical protein EA415_12975 [Sphaerobacteraceae bacterium]
MTLTDAQALAIAEEAVEQAGGARQVYMNPRHPFAPNSTKRYEIDGHQVTVRIGESSAPAIVEVGPYVFEIQPEGLMKLFGPDR